MPVSSSSCFCYWPICMKLHDSSANVATESTILQEIFYDNLFYISSQIYSFKNNHHALSSYHMCGWIRSSKNECSLARTNVGYMVRFQERREGPATFRKRSVLSHQKPETQLASANKCTINFIQLWVYMHYKNEIVKLFVTWIHRFE